MNMKNKKGVETLFWIILVIAIAVVLFIMLNKIWGMFK